MPPGRQHVGVRPARARAPRIGIEALGSQWLDRGMQANARIFRGWSGTRHGLLPAGTAPWVPTASPGFLLPVPETDAMRRAVPPVDDAMARADTSDTTVDEQLAGVMATRVEVDLELDTTMVVIPVGAGGNVGRSHKLLKSDIEGAFMGGVRHEQLFRCQAACVSATTSTRSTGTACAGFRRSSGIRDTAEFLGPQLAVGGSRAFGLIVFRRDPDGSPSYAEGYVFEGGARCIRHIVEVQWLTRIRARR